MFSGLSGQDVIAILGVIGAAFVALGKSIQWYIDRLDVKTQKAIELESDLRRKIEESFESRIKNLEVELASQREVIRILNAEKQVFLRRVYQLESYIQVSKLTVPPMEGWPP